MRRPGTRLHHRRTIKSTGRESEARVGKSRSNHLKNSLLFLSSKSPAHQIIGETTCECQDCCARLSGHKGDVRRNATSCIQQPEPSMSERDPSTSEIYHADYLSSDLCEKVETGKRFSVTGLDRKCLTIPQSEFIRISLIKAKELRCRTRILVASLAHVASGFEVDYSRQS